MNASDSDHAQRLGRVPELLRGYPAGTAEAAMEFLRHGDGASLSRLLSGVLTYHLPPNPDRRPIAEFGPEARLVADLGLDSLLIVELTFLLDELLGAQFTEAELRALTTLGDLHASVLAKRKAI